MTANDVMIDYLGDRSYPAILKEVHQKLLHSNADSLVGQQILGNAFSNLNESTTPVLTLKEFTTNAEQLAPHDAKLSEIVNFVKTKVKTGDMNFLINVCKEQHYQNLSRTGFPNTTDQTISEIEKEFQEPEGVIVQLIQKGIFDKLQSNLLMEIKSDLPASKNKIVTDTQIDNLNESSHLLSESVVTYNPIAVRCFSDEKVVLLMESHAFQVKEKAIIPLNEGVVNIQAAHQRLAQAAQELPYNIEDQTFSLASDWDFNLNLFTNGKVGFDTDASENGLYVDKDDVQSMLLESINKYTAEGLMSEDKLQSYVRDADNFVMLMENVNKLVLVDDIKVIKNVSNNDFVMINESTKVPAVLHTNCGFESFDSFSQLNESLSERFNVNMKPLFESLIRNEEIIFNNKNSLIVALHESQRELNKLIVNGESLISLAEVDSPAYSKLNESQKVLNNKLTKNIQTLTELSNFNKLYESVTPASVAEFAVQKTIGVNKPIRAAMNSYSKLSKTILQSANQLQQIIDDSKDVTVDSQQMLDIFDENLQGFESLNEAEKKKKKPSKTKEVLKGAAKGATSKGVLLGTSVGGALGSAAGTKGAAIGAAAGTAVGSAVGAVSGALAAGKKIHDKKKATKKEK